VFPALWLGRGAGTTAAAQIVRGARAEPLTTEPTAIRWPPLRPTTGDPPPYLRRMPWSVITSNRPVSSRSKSAPR
jgi:hypothetical protein